MNGIPTSAIEASLWLSLFAAPLGAFLVFRRLSFFGDALSHAALSGIAIVVVFIGTSPLWLSMGAVVSVIVTAGLLQILEKRARLPSDVALTVSYSGMFALGLLLLGSRDLDLEKLLLGDIWSIEENMLWFLRIWGVIAIVTMNYFWKSLWASVIDPHFAQGLGYKTARIDFLFLILTAVSIVGIIQSVGVVLVAAYLVLPAATVLPWVRSLRGLMLCSILSALLGSLFGIFISSRCNVPAGPAIAVASFVLLLVSHIGVRALKCQVKFKGPKLPGT